MRHLTALVLAAALTGAAVPGANGQVLIGWVMGELLAGENFNLGFDIGMNLSTVTGLEGATRKRGTRFGVFADWRFSEHLHFGSGIVFLSPKGARDLAPIPLNDDQLDPLIADGIMTRNLNHFDVPLMLKYAPHREKGFRVGAGAQINFLSSANDRYDVVSSSGAQTVLENDIESTLNPVGMDLVFDLEYRIGQTGIAIGVQYAHGLTDMVKDDGTTSMNRLLSGSGRIALGGRQHD